MLQGSGDDVHDGPLEAFGESFRGLPACTQLPRGAISPGEQSTIVRDCHLSTVGSVPHHHWDWGRYRGMVATAHVTDFFLLSNIQEEV